MHLSVSTVVPTFNRADLLDRALASVLPECGPGDEIIVVDDDSTDSTEDVVRAYGPPVRYLRVPHGGAGAARNAGIAAAHGDLVAFLDSDDEWVPGKLSWQRAVLEQLPEVLFVFTDFGSVTATGERQRRRITSWRTDQLSWEQMIGPGISSSDLPALPAGAPPFMLYAGQFYTTYISNWCIATSTVVVRRREAGDALHFAEDVPVYEDFECYARLAQRGLACYMDCETAWQHKHAGARLTGADAVCSAESALKITERIWGSDALYLSRHRDEYDAVMDAHRCRKARALLKQGRRQDARSELASCRRKPLSTSFVSYAPGRLTSAAASALQYVRARRREAGTACPPPHGWRIVEHRGRTGLEELEPDWRRLLSAMPHRTAYHSYEAHLAYMEHLMSAPDDLRCLALTRDDRVHAICVLEAVVDRTLIAPLRVWRAPFHPHVATADVICPEDEVRRRLMPALIAHLRRRPEGRRLLLLGPLPSDSLLWDGLRQLDSGTYCTDAAMSAHVIDCSRSFEELTAGLSKNSRAKLRKARKRLAACEDVRFTTVSDEPDLSTAYEAFLDVEASGWKGAAGTRTAIRFRQHQPSFFHDLTALHGSDDDCQIDMLYVDGRIIAAQFCVRTGHELAVLKIGYDETYRSLSPGYLLLERTLRRCCEDPGITRVCLVSDEAWHEQWRPASLPMMQAYVAIGPAWGRLIVALLKLRLGPARELARWARRKRDRSPRNDHGPAPRSAGGRRDAQQ